MPLRTWDPLLAFFGGTTTTIGLVIRAVFQLGDQIGRPDRRRTGGRGTPERRPSQHHEVRVRAADATLSTNGSALPIAPSGDGSLTSPLAIPVDVAELDNLLGWPAGQRRGVLRLLGHHRCIDQA